MRMEKEGIRGVVRGGRYGLAEGCLRTLSVGLCLGGLVLAASYDRGC